MTDKGDPPPKDKAAPDAAQSPIERLLAVMARLRDPAGGCPWDLEQSFATIAPHTIEEAYEVADAIERNDIAALKDELGDLLFQVVFYAQMASEAGRFDFDAIAAGIADKMVRRHPHVFGGASVDSAAAQTVAWEEQKAAERAAEAAARGARASALDGVIRGLPALTRAGKLQSRAARVGFDWPDAPSVLDKVEEEVEELRNEIDRGRSRAALQEEVGDLLFTCVNVARRLAIDPETALRHANAKFDRRFRRLEALLAAQGKTQGSATLDEMEAAWEQAKTEERENQL